MSNFDRFLNVSEPWTVYRTLVDLMDYPENDPRVIEAKAKMLSHPLVKGLLDELRHWPGTVISSHKSSGQLYHRLTFLADLGITVKDDGMPDIVSKILAHRSPEGLVRLPVGIPVVYGGSGEETSSWALCDAPLSLYSLAKMGMKDDPSIRKGLGFLVGLARQNGWPCAVSLELGSFRGPGKKSDPCPYVNLIMLKLLALYDDLKAGDQAKAGVKSLLECWEKSREIHPYMFFMGTDFRKLKAPFIWYDLLHVVEALSHFEEARIDPRFREMLALVHSKADPEGWFVPESEWKAWKGWDFGQKKNPSSWMSFLIARIDKRVWESDSRR